MDTKGQQSSEQWLEEYHRDGYAVLPDFLNAGEVTELRRACDRIVDELNFDEHPATVFSTADHSETRDSYFLESGDKVRYFFEEDALDEQRQLKVPAKIVTITPHQDSTFLATEPLSCVGLWFALEDATLENGCLWFSPGSQHQPTTRRFIRSKEPDGRLTTRLIGSPAEDDPSTYVAVPVRKGSLVIIHGSVNHKSAMNTSAKSRHVYTFHVIEQHNTRWDPYNWLQPTENMPFTNLYTN
ncbi:phytanoyl-CoA dioxygenase domain-containing protein 1 [Hyalella azteca]|uniref:Phytanoyl-CoA dioxygenase domain-containing protein 1 n=1 Tax=Hyalella azteca TaxID=294128 RepID=A0A8B7PMX8_HYAAZ|nr:phytanoyl-CoA dioxygenase domain-containing protein 1 [Hyalella azteca]